MNKMVLFKETLLVINTTGGTGSRRDHESITQTMKCWKMLVLAHLGKYRHCVDGNPGKHVLFFWGNMSHNWI